MPEAYAREMVRAGETLMVPCPNDQRPSLSMEWLTVDSGTLIGHWLNCATCRPDGVWSCAFCAALVAPDAEAIRAHVAECCG